MCATKKGTAQLFVTLYTVSIYLSVDKQLIGTLFEAHIVPRVPRNPNFSTGSLLRPSRGDFLKYRDLKGSTNKRDTQRETKKTLRF